MQVDFFTGLGLAAMSLACWQDGNHWGSGLCFGIALIAIFSNINELKNQREAD